MGFIAFLFLLLLAVVVLVIFAGQNGQAETVSLFNYQWHGVPEWIPVAIAAALVTALFFLYLLVAGTSSRLERASLRRRLRQMEGRDRGEQGDERAEDSRRDRGFDDRERGRGPERRPEEGRRPDERRADEPEAGRATASESEQAEERPVAPDDRPSAG